MGYIYRLPITNIPAVLDEIHERLWASEFSMKPLYSDAFYTKGEVEKVLVDHVKPFINGQQVKYIGEEKPSILPGYKFKIQ